jgi:hypothetical protein
MVSPVLADVFVPAGPANTAYGNQSEWISPTLAVFESTSASKITSNPIGWYYTNGPTYNTQTATGSAAVSMANPWAFTSTGFSNTVSPSIAFVPYGQQVTIVGYIPGVNVAYNEIPPEVELQITWNGIPDVVSLTVPSNQVVGTMYPPQVYPAQTTTYTYTYPTTGANKAATYNLWDGNSATILSTLWGTTTAPAWWQAVYGPAGSAQNGEWFWYTFTPNAGDWIGFGETHGQCSTPPTYDITAMFEYGTSQIWFNHVAFNDCLLQLYKSLTWCTDQTINDQILVTNVGLSTSSLATVTNLNLTQTFPSASSLTIYPLQANAMISIVKTSDGSTVEPPMMLPNVYNLENPNVYVLSTSGLPSAYTTLAPGQTMVISLLLEVTDTGSSFSGTIVFDAQAWAAQIAPWKAPLAIGYITYPDPCLLLDPITTGSPQYLWTGAVLSVQGGVLTYNPAATTIGGVSTSVMGPVLRVMLSDPAAAWILDPAPLPLIAGETAVTSADVALVRNMVLGLAPYNPNADCNANGYITIQDLKEYESAAGMS